MKTPLISLLTITSLVGCAGNNSPIKPPEPQVKTAPGTLNAPDYRTARPDFSNQDDTLESIPEAVVRKFQTDYPHATNVEYDTDINNGMKHYKIEFMNAGKKRQIHYSADGRLLKSERDD